MEADMYQQRYLCNRPEKVTDTTQIAVRPFLTRSDRFHRAYTLKCRLRLNSSAAIVPLISHINSSFSPISEVFSSPADSQPGLGRGSKT